MSVLWLRLEYHICPPFNSARSSTPVLVVETDCTDFQTDSAVVVAACTRAAAEDADRPFGAGCSTMTHLGRWCSALLSGHQCLH